MRLIALCAVPPWPVVDGGRRRTLELLAALAEHAEVHLRAVEEPGSQGAELPVDAAAFASVQTFPRSPLRPGVAPFAARPERWFHSRALAGHLQRSQEAKRADALFLDEPWLLRAVPRDAAPIVAHHHKLELELSRALGQPWHERARVARLERLLAHRAALHVFAGEEDRVRFLGRHSAVQTMVLPAGIDPTRFVPGSAPRERASLLFFGSLGYEPNRQGLRWILTELLPALRARGMEVELDVVGAGEVGDLRDLADERTTFVGYVADPLPWLQRATALLAPIEIAGGSRQKLVEALAAGCPVVATPRAGEGMPDAEHWLRTANLGAPFVERVAQVLREPEAEDERAHAAAEHARRAWSWPALALRLERALRELGP